MDMSLSRLFVIIIAAHCTAASPVHSALSQSLIPRQDDSSAKSSGPSTTTILVPCIIGGIIILAAGFCCISRHKAKKRREAAVRENRRVTKYQQRPKTMLGARPSSMFRPWSMVSGSSQPVQGDRVSVLYDHHKLVSQEQDQYYKADHLSPPMPQYAMNNVTKHGGGSRSPSPLRY